MSSVMRGAIFEVGEAPEPSDLWWENLATSTSERRRLTIRVYCVVLVLVALTLLALVLLKVLQAGLPSVLGFANTDRAVQFSTGMGAASTVVHFAANLVIKALIKKMAAMARPPSRTFYERSLFTLLSIAWCINTVALPFVVGIIPFGLTQAFYEAGGVIQHVCLLAVIGVFPPSLAACFRSGRSSNAMCSHPACARSA